MNKVLLFLLSIIIVVGIIACDGTVEPIEEEGPFFALIVDDQGLVEEGYNDLAWKGFEKAETDLDVRIRIFEATSPEDYLINIKTAVEEGAVLIVCNGASMVEVVKQASLEYPEQAFALIDGKVEADNVSSYTFTLEGAAFLAGVLAATVSETDIIGFVWDVKNPDSEKLQYGFEAGTISANSTSQALINYTNFSGDELLCKETALAQNKLGVDVVFHGAGGCGKGVNQGAEEQEFWVIGMDKGQSLLNPDYSLSVVYKAFDLASYMAIENYENGVAYNVNYNFSLKDGGVDLINISEKIDEESLLTLKSWKNKIIEGEILVPYDASTFAQFFIE